MKKSSAEKSNNIGKSVRVTLRKSGGKWKGKFKFDA